MNWNVRAFLLLVRASFRHEEEVPEALQMPKDIKEASGPHVQGALAWALSQSPARVQLLDYFEQDRIDVDAEEIVLEVHLPESEFQFAETSSVYIVDVERYSPIWHSIPLSRFQRVDLPSKTVGRQ